MLHIPEGYSVRRVSDPQSREAVTRWLRGSPDHTLYHLWPYIDFTRAQNGRADVFLISRDGNPLFALTVHFWSGMGVDSGYSGVVFPATRREGQLRRSVRALAEVFAENRRMQFRMHQSAQATAYEDLERATLLQRLVEGEGLRLEPVYGRLLGLGHLPVPGEVPTLPGRNPGARALDPDWLAGDALRPYDAGARNQIRQAIRRGLTVEYVVAKHPQARADVYERFQPVHEESWQRTGLVVKEPYYWIALSESVVAGGGEDLVVLALDPSGKPLAGVLAHAYQSRAIYWSGAGTADGLRARANPLCLHGAIAACRQVGVETFELGRFRADESSKKQRAITDYKGQFGGELLRVTTFSTMPGLTLRARTAGATAAFEVRRRLTIAAVRARSRLQVHRRAV